MIFHGLCPGPRRTPKLCLDRNFMCFTMSMNRSWRVKRQSRPVKQLGCNDEEGLMNSNNLVLGMRDVDNLDR